MAQAARGKRSGQSDSPAETGTEFPFSARKLLIPSDSRQRKRYSGSGGRGIRPACAIGQFLEKNGRLSDRQDAAGRLLRIVAIDLREAVRLAPSSASKFFLRILRARLYKLILMH